MKLRSVSWMAGWVWLAAGAAFGLETLSIRGSDTFGEELGPKLIAAFQAEQPGVAVELESLGSVSGIAALLDETCDIAVSSRLFTDDEQRIARSRGIELKSAVAGYFGLAVVVNDRNPLKNLSDRAILDIFTGRTTNWKQVGGPDQPIQVFIRDASGGSHLGFRFLAMENRAYAAFARPFPTHVALAEAVAAHPEAIGYVGMNLVAHPGLHPVSVNGVSPAAVAVREGRAAWRGEGCGCGPVAAAAPAGRPGHAGAPALYGTGCSAVPCAIPEADHLRSDPDARFDPGRGACHHGGRHPLRHYHPRRRR